LQTAEKKMKRSTQQDRKKQKISLMTVLAVAAAVVVVASVALLWVFRSGEAAGARKKALQIGDETYSVAQVNFFYFSALDELLENANGYSELLGLDAGQDLSAQACPLSDSDESWKAYLLRQAEEGLQKVSVLCAEAECAGGTSGADAKAEIDSELEYYSFLGQTAGYEDFDTYLEKTYGEGMNETLLRALLERIYLADSYEQTLRASYAFTERQLRDYYEENAYLYTEYSYLFAYVDGGLAGADEICGELAKAKTQSEFETATLKKTGQACYPLTNVKGSELGDHTSADVLWLTDASRAPGDTYIGKTSAAAYVLYFIGQDDNGFSASGDGAWKADAEQALQDETFASWLADAMAAYPVKEYRAIVSVGNR